MRKIIIQKLLNVPWNIHDKLNINTIRISQDNELLIASTNIGYRIFDIETFTLLNNLIEDYHNNIGNISNALNFYSSHIIFFHGYENNEKYKSNCLCYANEMKKECKKLIQFKEEIYNFYLNKYIIIIIFTNKIVLFDLLKLQYIKTISDIASNNKEIVSYNIDKDFLYIGKVGINCPNKIEIYIYSIIKKKEIQIIELKKEIEVNNFDSINTIFIDGSNTNYLIATSKFSNKIHIYSKDKNFNYTLKFCIYLGNQLFTLNNFLFSENTKYFIVLVNNYIIHIYKLNKILLKRQNTNAKNINTSRDNTCVCKVYNDNEINMSLSNKLSSHSFISGIYSKFTGATSIFQRIVIEKIKEENILIFQKKMKKTFSVIQIKGGVVYIQYGKKGKGKVIKKIKWLH